jgi:hypothetical protein
MKYMILSYEPKANLGEEDSPHAVRPILYTDLWLDFIETLHRAGIIRSFHHLRPDFTATTVRLRDGRTVLHDGAYADSNEQIAACLVIEVANLDVALSWAERCPAAASGAVEVRPLFPDDAGGA